MWDSLSEIIEAQQLIIWDNSLLTFRIALDYLKTKFRKENETSIQFNGTD